MVPLRIYLAWHPRFEIHVASGTRIDYVVEQVAKAFPRAGERVEGLRIRIEPRCEASEARKQIDPLLARRSLVFLLIDPAFSGDKQLQEWVNSTNNQAGVTIIPVRFDDEGMEGDEEVDNFHELGLSADSVKPERAIEELRRLISFYSLNELHGEELERKRFFVSFRRGEGSEIAEKLAQAMFDHGHTWRAFVDKKELGAGKVLEEKLPAAVRDSAAMIAIHTKRFGISTWCEKEIGWATDPTPVLESTNAWRLNPLVVVDALGDDEWSVVDTAFAGCRVTRWRDDRDLEIIDEVLAEALASAYYAAWSREVDGPVAINWTPNSHTLVSVLRKVKLPRRKSERIVVHPGFGLSKAQKKKLQDVHRITLITFEEL